MESWNIIEFLLILLAGVMGWFLKNLNKRVTDIEKDMSEMRLNYITRFDDAKDHRHEMQSNIVETLNKIDKKLDVHIAKTNI